MDDSHASARTVSFGVLTADLHSGELRKNGVKVRLERQPFQVLAILLEHPRELVTREELRKRVWPEDTFVDFDHALNTAVTKIRVAVGDDADNPRFVETVPRRGYRFIAPVNGDAARLPLNTDKESVPPVHNRVLLPAVAVVVLLVLGGLSALYWRPSLGPPKVLKYSQLTSDGKQKDQLVTDGARLYFQMSDGPVTVLAQVSIAGGEVTRIPVPFQDVQLQDISPDGSELMVRPGDLDPGPAGDRTTYLLPLPTGTPRRLGDAAWDEATWSPDGQEILYIKGSELYITKRDGSAFRKLVTVKGDPSFPRWSPDGKLIRFSITEDEIYSTVWEVQENGSNLHKLFLGSNNPGAIECCGQWTRDGRYFVFLSWRDPHGTGTMHSANLWAVRETPQVLRRINHDPVPLTVTSAGTTEITSFVPSRDGKRLFVVAGNDRNELVRYDKRSGQFLPYLPGVNGTKFVFSRDGIWVAYVSIADDTLWRSKVDGTERLQLTFPPMSSNMVPSWSPDGSQIAFAAALPGGPFRIFRISRDGGSPEQLTEGKHGAGDITPSWSSDGKSLVFGEFAPAMDFPTRVWLLDLRTRKLTSLPESEGRGATAWSPDGRYISAFSPKGELSVFDFATEKWTEIVKSATRWYSWSRDGKYIQFEVFLKGESVLKRVNVRDHKVQLVTNLKELGRNGVSYETWLGVAPDGSPLALRNVSSYDIFALDLDLP